MKQRPSPVLVAILTLSVLLRIIVALYLGNEVDAPPLLTDQRSYHALGVRLLEGHGFSFDRNWYPFTVADTPTSHWSFLYSLLVAGVYSLFGPYPLAMRLVQAIVGGLLLPWMVYRLAATLFSGSSRKDEEQSKTIALVAAFVSVIHGYFVLYAATLMTETLFLITLLWSLERGLTFSHRLDAGESLRSLWPLGLTLGLSLGLATLVRQSILPWVPVLMVYLLALGWRKAQLRAAVVTLGLVGLILVAFVVPWTVRNYLVYDDFLLLNSNAGYAMYSAQHPLHGTRFHEFGAAPIPEEWWGRSEPELDRDLMQLGIQFILDDPGRYLRLSLSRVRAFIEFWPTPDTTLLHNVGRIGSTGLLLPFLIYGLVLAFRRAGFVRRNALLFLFAVFYTVLHLLTWAMVRYRLPVEAALVPLAALSIAELIRRVRPGLALQAR
ncbi:MAG: glycosyltransferase family 39 protein [Anaerolineae bacterium]|jgi:hypothetical protein|nr:glycosyltransferase family 39 protein [Anaerolineae bacterium]